jgi:predicted ABC-type ATPase
MKLLREYIRLLIEQSDTPKVIFMAGGPGSGKSTVIKKLGLSSRLKIINPDEQYEKTLKAEGLPLDRASMLDEYKPLRDRYLKAEEEGDMETVKDIEPEYLRLRGLLSRNMVLFNKARKASKKDQADHIAAGEEFLVDGTGGHYSEVANQVEKLESAGYDVGMIFIDVPVETSVSRDKTRGESGGRRLGRKTVEKSWLAVSKNKALYEELFGDDFFYVDASEESFEDSIDLISADVSRFLS